jgi:hypothetical protein
MSGRRAPPINFRGLQMDPFTPLTHFWGKAPKRRKNKGFFKGNIKGNKGKDYTVGEGM